MRTFLVVGALLIALVVFACILVAVQLRKRADTRKNMTPLLGVVAPRPGSIVKVAEGGRQETIKPLTAQEFAKFQSILDATPEDDDA